MESKLKHFIESLKRTEAILQAIKDELASDSKEKVLRLLSKSSTLPEIGNQCEIDKIAECLIGTGWSPGEFYLELFRTGYGDKVVESLELQIEKDKERIAKLTKEIAATRK